MGDADWYLLTQARSQLLRLAGARGLGQCPAAKVSIGTRHWHRRGLSPLMRPKRTASCASPNSLTNSWAV